MKKQKKNRRSGWQNIGMAMAILFMLILLINAMSLFINVRRDMLYNSRSYGLSVLNDHFDNGEYYEVYLKTCANRYADDELSVDVSQYAAFGRYYNALIQSKTHEDDSKYLKIMEEAKKEITWKKILRVIEELENENQ